MIERFAHYKTLSFVEHPHAVLEVIMGTPGRLATADHDGHRELARVWRDIGDDPEVRAVVLRGEGKGFSAGGDFSLVEEMATDHYFDIGAARRELGYSPSCTVWEATEKSFGRG
jgi:enoyl-CoA hydratase